MTLFELNLQDEFNTANCVQLNALDTVFIAFTLPSDMLRRTERHLQGVHQKFFLNLLAGIETVGRCKKFALPTEYVACV
jgi:hypothetical protein